MKGIIIYIAMFIFCSFAAQASSTEQLVFENEEQQLLLYYDSASKKNGFHSLSIVLPDGESYNFDSISQHVLHDGRRVLSGFTMNYKGSAQLYFSELGDFLRGSFAGPSAEYKLSGSRHSAKRQLVSFNFTKTDYDDVPAHQNDYSQEGGEVYTSQILESNEDFLVESVRGAHENKPDTLSEVLTLSEANTLSISGSPADHTIRMLVAYTPAAAAQMGNIHGRIDDYIMQTNMVFNESNLGDVVQVELAHTFMLPLYTPASYDPIGSGYQLALMSKRSDLRQIRDIYGADVVAVVFAGSQLNDCGRAHTNPNSRGAYFIVSANSTCYDKYTFAHELGHIFGASHNPSDASAGNPAYWPEISSPYSYGHGLRNLYAIPGFRTIMAYECDARPCERVPIFSSPLLTYQGKSAGDSNRRNNQRVIQQRAETIASFGGDPYPGDMPPDLSILPFYCKGQHELH